jgi:hypothetical protein
MMMQSLDQVRKQLTATINNPAMFSLINTRLILRTGVDLVEFKPSDNQPANVEKVLAALKAMGFPLDAT